MSPVLLREGTKAQGPQAREWEEGEAETEKELGLLDRLVIPQPFFRHGMPDLSDTENSYKECSLVLGFRSGVTGSALVKLN